MTRQHIARIIRTCELPMTNQALADLALAAHRDSRQAFRRGDYARANRLQVEINELLEQMT